MEDTHLNMAKLVCPLSYIHAKIHSPNKQKNNTIEAFQSLDLFVHLNMTNQKHTPIDTATAQTVAHTHIYICIPLSHVGIKCKKWQTKRKRTSAAIHNK